MKKQNRPVVRSGEELIAPDGFSIALLIEELQDRPSMLMVQSEYGAFLKELDKLHNQGAKETLTDIYDSGMYIKFNKTIKAENDGKPIKIDNTALSIYSATTKEWLQEYVKLSDIGAGFIARFLFVPASEKTRFYGWPKTRDEEKYENIKRNIASLRSTVKGEFDTSQIKPFYELWCEDLMERARHEDDISKTIGFDSRLAIYALKFTMILHASKYKNTTITLDSLVVGIQLAEYFRGKTKELLDTTFLSKFDQNLRKVAMWIFQNQHAMTRRQIQMKAGGGNNRIKAFELKEIFEILEAEGDLMWDREEKALISKASKYLKGMIR